MDTDARNHYLEQQVLTATPQKLRLMLVEAAIAAARKTLTMWQEKNAEEALESLIRCRNIISELLSGVRPDGSPLAKNVIGIYMFLFRTITEAQLKNDRQKMADVISVLEVEVETWRTVCEQMPHAPEFSEELATQYGSGGAAPIVMANPNESIGGPNAGQLCLDA